MNISKYSASGNDFVIFHTFLKKNRSDLAIKLCDRFDGVGADGLVVLVPHDKYDFEWEFYNSDGSLASMCANASRAVAHYAYTNNLAPSSMSFLTGAGVIEAVVEDDIVQSRLTKPIELYKEFEELGFVWYGVDTGVPHLVTIVDDLDKFDLDIASKMRYKYDTNVNFIKIDGKDLRVRTYERGVEGETMACGTGMVAGFLYTNGKNLIDNRAFVYPKSKEQLVVSKQEDSLFFKGRVSKVFNTDIS
jgi:diaminopimelate epimerase